MKKMSKQMELSFKALGAAMFMGTVFLHMAIGALFGFISEENFYYNVSFALLIQGMAVSMLASAAWVLCFGCAKPWGFVPRYLLALVVLAALFAISIYIPVINSTENYFTWVVSGVVSTLAFGSAVAMLSNKRFRKTGSRSTLLWELN